MKYMLLMLGEPAEDDDEGAEPRGEVVEKLFLKDKEVVSSARRQYAIARALHARHHGGINRTTASIAERYHWLRIKDTATLAIRNCEACSRTAAGGSNTAPPNAAGGTGNVLLAAEGLQALRGGPVPAARAGSGWAPINQETYLPPGVGVAAEMPIEVVDPMLLDGQFGRSDVQPAGEVDDIDAMERLLQPLNGR